LLRLVLYTKDPEGEMVWKITDFGFSSTTITESPLKPLTFGHMTRNYFAPEFLIGSRYNQKADIWSAGCILYELATGFAPFSTDEAVREFAWFGRSIPSVYAARIDLDETLDAMIKMMLHVTPTARPEATDILVLIPKDPKLVSEEMDEVPKNAVGRIDCCDASLGANRYVARIQGRAEIVIIESHKIDNHTPHLHSDIRKLISALRLLNDIPRCLVPRCIGFSHLSHGHYSLIFQSPSPLTPHECECTTLANILTRPGHPSFQALLVKSTKVRLAAALAQTIHIVHQNGYSHRSFSLQNILINPSLLPCIMGFDININQETKVVPRNGDIWQIRLYQHPECQSSKATEIPFRREFDYYSLGVVLLEIGMVERLPVKNGLPKREIVNLNPEALQMYLQNKARELETTVGKKYSEVVVRCLAGDFGGVDQESVGWIFKTDVCDVLDNLYSA